jgi:hypothetical protein
MFSLPHPSHALSPLRCDFVEDSRLLVAPSSTFPLLPSPLSCVLNPRDVGPGRTPS